MKKIILKATTAVAFACTMLTAQADWEITSTGSTFQVSDGTWTLNCKESGDEGDFTLVSVASGGDADIDLIALNSDIDTADMDYSLIGIGSKAFRNVSVKNMTIPKTVTYIGEYCFNPSGSSNSITGSVTFEEESELTRFVFQSFQNAQLTSINLDACKKLEKIETYTFAGCKYLTSIGTGVLPDTMIEIGTGAFSGCSSLVQSISCNARLCFSGGSQFKETGVTAISFPNAYGDVGTYFCNACPNLKSVVLSSEITAFKQQAFGNCSAIESFLPAEYPNVTEIGTFTFSTLKAIKTPFDFSKAKFTSLSGQCFSTCQTLPEIRLPATLTSVGDYVFKLTNDCDFYFYGLPPSVTNGSFQNGTGRGNFLILQENAVTWTNNTVSGYTFTPLADVPEKEKTDEYQYPEGVRVLGKIAVGTAPVGTHWISLIPVTGTIILIN